MFRRDSRLVIEDPTGFVTDSLGHPMFPLLRYWVWTGTRLVVQAQVKVDTLGVRLPVQ